MVFIADHSLTFLPMERFRSHTRVIVSEVTALPWQHTSALASMHYARAHLHDNNVKNLHYKQRAASATILHTHTHTKLQASHSDPRLSGSDVCALPGQH